MFAIGRARPPVLHRVTACNASGVFIVKPNPFPFSPNHQRYNDFEDIATHSYPCCIYCPCHGWGVVQQQRQFILGVHLRGVQIYGRVCESSDINSACFFSLTSLPTLVGSALPATISHTISLHANCLMSRYLSPLLTYQIGLALRKLRDLSANFSRMV